MSESRRPIARLTYSVKGGNGYENYSVLSVWPTDKPDRYDISSDRGSEKYPAMTIVDALKAFVGRGGRFGLQVTMPESSRQPRAEAPRNREPSGGFGDDPPSQFGDDSDIPF